MRIRYLKPEFFKDEILAQLSFEARLTFAGLWCMADKAGRLEDCPSRIKAELFSSDLSKINQTIEVESVLDQLSKKPFIKRYMVDGKKYIEIINFLKHQNIHRNEKESKLPSSNDKSAVITGQVPELLLGNGELVMGNGEWGRGERNNSDSVSNAQDLTLPEQQRKPQEKVVKKERSKIEMSEAYYHGIENAWNKFAEKYNLNKIIGITKPRQAKLKMRSTEKTFDFGLILEAIEEQPFLIHGNPNSSDHGNWHVTFDWVIENKSNYIKILERSYKGGASKNFNNKQSSYHRVQRPQSLDGIRTTTLS